MAFRTCKITSRYSKDVVFSKTTLFTEPYSSSLDSTDIKDCHVCLDFDNGSFWKLVGQGKQDNQQMLNAQLLSEKFNLYRIKGYTVTISTNQEVGLAQKKPSYSWLLSTTQDEDDALSSTQEDNVARAVDYMRNHPTLS